MSKKRMYYRSDFYRRILTAKKPGQSLADLAREHSLDPARLYSYRAYLKRSKPPAPDAFSPVQSPVPLLPVVLKTTDPGPGFDLTLEGLGTLKIPANFDPASLKRLIQTLRTSAC